jgi:hypothetical protein
MYEVQIPKALLGFEPTIACSIGRYYGHYTTPPGQKIVFIKLPSTTLAGFDLTTHISNLLVGRWRPRRQVKLLKNSF